ncbi:hypothetical protein MGG_05706 [Pyricularia oryzae 70-15]|uniref:HTH La-type RNA-binding domain-containing protein n=4 Tax=Pyricularia oryzae TaxID=318829 RepID=G4MP44_PYRO7|nr:uncharacterized protein MGG_05706 [Pyricularia oryzae 70-15]ELQ39083.1 hypothetical protein OOU_Y34scaffold00515g2 [Pyricularia oryzae Y34]KAI7917943.1 hypothetical protein M9X92_007134 [Pyricularia oryzae]EHA57993.1 hypothetical protein MGG_05706 [Pyricularia oryzae 70-15]KAI7931318.1 hypothetical protein M0657_001272 [Pyricularia oryzae]QBZ63862.1 hypothetical protein PoMZ_05553 [Pyricularia oryzae]
MASTLTKPASSADTPASAPAFSYAQAARGQVATPATTPQPESSAPPSTTNTVGSSVTSSVASDVQDIPKALQDSTDLSTVKVTDSELSSVVGSTTQESRDDAVSVAGSQSQPAAKGSETRRPRKGKKGKNQDKTKEDEQDRAKENLKTVEQVKVQLSEAPIPSVNVWQERAKQNPAPQKSVASTTTATTPEAKKAENGPAVRVPKKPLESSRNAVTPNESRRTAPRGSRVQAENPPSVQDPTLWPSIELAAVDDGKSKPTEKPAVSEKPDEASASSKPKKEWTHFPITPTYTYETQFSQHAKQPRPRGGARGGREPGSTRGGHASASGPSEDKEPASATAVSTKGQTESKERPRDAAAPHARQTSQAPTVPKRGGMDTSAREPRKAAGASPADKAKGEHAATSYPAKGDAPTRGSRAELTNGDHAPADRRKHSGERNHARGHDGNGENGHHSVREGRSERGRGGYRGRGGGAGHNGAGHHQQGNFGPNGQRYMGGANGMGSQPFNPASNQFQYSGHGNGRKFPSRAQTGPAHNGQRAHNGANMAGRMPSLPVTTSNQEYSMQAYPPVYPAPHYGDELIVQGLKAQIEFYLSLDNLAGDLYLRQRMDSQGFVRLTTIAGFRRVESLSPRFDFIQAACAQSQEIDYVTGDDGTERVRSRHDMTPYILEYSRRAEEGKSNGPASVIYHNIDRHTHPIPYGNGYPHHMYTSSPTNYHTEFPNASANSAVDPHAYSMYPVNGSQYGHGPVMNGHYPVNGHQLSATVPDFSPVSQQRPSIEEFQQFKDSDIENLTVMVADNKPRVSVKGAADENLANGSANHGSSSEGANEANKTNYPAFHSQALEQRKKSAPGETCPDMHNLYRFWVDFLSNSFNNKLYTEFRQLALDDGAKQPPSPAGVRYLLGFYENLVNSRRPYPAVLDSHYHEARKVSDALSSVTNGEVHA